MFRGMLVVRPKIREGQNLSLHPYPEKRYIKVWCISTLPGVAVVRPKTRTRNETRPRFGGPETHLVLERGRHEQGQDLVEERPGAELARLVGQLAQRRLAHRRRAVLHLWLR